MLLGSNRPTRQRGVLGKASGVRVEIDLDGCNTVTLCGVQGAGKSYSMGVLAEGAAQSIPGANELEVPLATIAFHYHPSDAYEPELLAARRPNAEESEVKRLRDEYGAEPAALADLVLLVPEAQVEQRRAEYPGVQVEPITFSSKELKAAGWKFLLGAYGNDSLYLRQLSAMLRKHRDCLTLDLIRAETEAAGFSDVVRGLVLDRLKLAEPYVDDSKALGDLLRPGRTILVDLRDPWIEKQEALELFVILMQIFAATRPLDAEGEPLDFNRLVIFDEAHKYMVEGEIMTHVCASIREMRHQATTVLIASQDPLSVPRIVIELSTVLVLHRMTSPAWIKHIRTAVHALEYLSEKELAELQPGEALVWAQRSTDRRFTLGPQKITIRPRATAHGGGRRRRRAGRSGRRRALDA